jgi:hypothetical protein
MSKYQSQVNQANYLEHMTVQNVLKITRYAIDINKNIKMPTRKNSEKNLKYNNKV